MTTDKYRLTERSQRALDGSMLWQIARLSDGKLGGWVAGLHNLSQQGACWIAEHAQVRGNATVTDGATISGQAQVVGRAVIRDQATISGQARVTAHAIVAGNAVVNGSAEIWDGAHIDGVASVTEQAKVFGSACITGRAYVGGHARVRGNATVRDVAVHGNADIAGDAVVAPATPYWALAGFKYPVTYTASDDSLCIGCQRDTVADWRARNWRGLAGEYDPRLATTLELLFGQLAPAVAFAPPPASQPPAGATRPCRPGDQLLAGCHDCGAKYLIYVCAPAAGEIGNLDQLVALELRVWLPGALLTQKHADAPMLLQERAGRSWGFPDGIYRERRLRLAGNDIWQLLTELQSQGDQALAYAASQAAQQQQQLDDAQAARAAVYAQYQVPCSPVRSNHAP